jgi:hypothetical protein
MARAVSPRPVTAEARVRVRVNPRGVYSGKKTLGQVFLRVLQFFSVNIISPCSPYSYIIWGMNSMSVRGSSSETYEHSKRTSETSHNEKFRNL